MIAIMNATPMTVTLRRMRLFIATLRENSP
jgi:hypothetical protein